MLTLRSSPNHLTRQAFLAYGRAMSINKRIAMARKHAKLTQLEIGLSLGLTKQAVTQWEREGGHIKKENLAELAKLTGVSIGWLITGYPLPERTTNGTLIFRDSGGRTVPIITAKQAVSGQFSDQAAERIPAIFPCGERAFAIVIDDRSNIDLLIPGTRAVFDPDLVAKPEDVVIAALGDDGDSVIGRLTYETTAAGKVAIVSPLNPAFGAERSDIANLVVIAPPA